MMKKGIAFACLLGILVACGTSKKSSTTSTKMPTQKMLAQEELQAKTRKYFHDALHNAIIKNMDQAAVSAGTYVAMNPKDDAGYFLLSKIQFQKGDTVNAVQSLKNAWLLDKNNPTYNQLLGTIYLAQKKYKEAEELYTDLVAKQPQNIDYISNLLEAQFGQKKYDNCLKTIDKIEGIVGKTPQTFLQRYQTYNAMNKPEEARTTLETAAEQFPDDPQALFALSDLYEKKKDKSNFTSFLEGFTTKFPDNAFAKLLLAQNYLLAGQTVKAQPLLLDAYSNEAVPSEYKRYFLVDNAVHNRLIPDFLSAKLAEIAAKEDPKDSFYPLFLGDYYERQNQPDKALENYKKSIRIHPDSKQIMFRIVFMEYKKRDFDSLVVYATKALELYPTEPDLYYFQAIGLLNEKQYDKCLEAVDNGMVYVTDKDSQADLQSIRGEAYFGKNDLVNAEKTYENAIHDFPKNGLLKANYALALAKKKVNLDEALNLVNQAIAADAKNSKYLYNKAVILFQRGEFSDALEIANQLFKTNPDDPAVNEILGDIYFKKNDVTTALQFWNKAKDFGSTSQTINQKIKDKKFYEEPY